MVLMPSEFSCGDDPAPTPHIKYPGETVPGEWRWWERVSLSPRQPGTSGYVATTKVMPTTTTSNPPTTTEYAFMPTTRAATTKFTTAKDSDEDFSFSGEEEVTNSLFYEQEEFFKVSDFTRPVNDAPQSDFTRPANDEPRPEDTHNLDLTNEVDISKDNPDKLTKYVTPGINKDATGVSKDSLRAQNSSGKVTKTPYDEVSADAPYNSGNDGCFFLPSALSSNTRDNVK